MIYPSLSMINPEPRERWTKSLWGVSPKKRLKNSSPKKSLKRSRSREGGENWRKTLPPPLTTFLVLMFTTPGLTRRVNSTKSWGEREEGDAATLTFFVPMSSTGLDMDRAG